MQEARNAGMQEMKTGLLVGAVAPSLMNEQKKNQGSDKNTKVASL